MTDTARKAPDAPDPLVRGEFSDGRTDLTVRASSALAPDSFQVFANGDHTNIVLIVSGLVSRQPHATWGDEWRPYPPDWKIWIEDAAFQVFYNGRLVEAPRGVGGTRPRQVRFCDG